MSSHALPRRAAVALGLVLAHAHALTVSAATDPAPEGGGQVADTGLPWPLIGLVVVAGVAVVAALRPSLRPWAAGAAILVAGSMVAALIILTDAVSRMDTGGGIGPTSVVVAAAVLLGGAALATFVTRSMRAARRRAQPAAE